ncbi:MAG: hypothetical protein ACXACF_08510 [Candidatus Hermodarchaeia archaeon]|jgi:hypothetical protein
MSYISHQTKKSGILLPTLVAIGMIAYFVALVYAFSNLHLIFPGFPQPPLTSALRYFILPLAFAFPWILFVFIFRERTINATEIMNLKGNLIPLRWRMLYGFNTLIILGFFIFPFISPPLGIFAALVLAYRLVHRSENIWQKSQGTRIGYTLILFILLAAVPVYLTIIWFQYILAGVAGAMLLGWIFFFDPLYFTSLCIVNALSLGALLALSYGTLDDKGKVTYGDSKKMWYIWFGQLIIIIVQWILLNPFPIFYNLWGFTFAGPDPIGFAGNLGNITYINYICLGIIAIVYFVRFILKIGGPLRLSIIGILFASAFLIVEILSSLFILPGSVIRPVLIIGSSLIFIIAFTISFFAASDELIEKDELIGEETDHIGEQATKEAETATEETEEVETES